MNNAERSQGYFIGHFLKFVGLFIISFTLQFMFVYIFGANFFTYYILSIIFSFFINTSLYIKDAYPFLRHILINICVLLGQSQIAIPLVDNINEFYTPTNTWVILMMISLFIGVVTTFGRYTYGTYSKSIESLGNLILLAFIIIGFFLFGWKGAVMYLLFRTLFITVEVWIANIITYLLTRGNSDHTEDF